MFIVMMVIALVALALPLIYLLDFARASRSDALFHPASSGHVVRARRVAGVYVRGEEDVVETDDEDEDEDELIGR